MSRAERQRVGEEGREISTQQPIATPLDTGADDPGLFVPRIRSNRMPQALAHGCSTIHAMVVPDSEYSDVDASAPVEIRGRFEQATFCREVGEEG